MLEALGSERAGAAAATTTTSDKAYQHGGCEYGLEYEQGRFRRGAFQGVLLYGMTQRRGHQNGLTSRRKKEQVETSPEWNTLSAVLRK